LIAGLGRRTRTMIDQVGVRACDLDYFQNAPLLSIDVDAI
jgi:hypothetical protein